LKNVEFALLWPADRCFVRSAELEELKKLFVEILELRPYIPGILPPNKSFL